MKIFFLSFVFCVFTSLIMISCDQPEPISGCTDEIATNYNSDAIIEDGTCNYGQSELIWNDEFDGSTLDASKWTCLLYTSPSPRDRG